MSAVQALCGRVVDNPWCVEDTAGCIMNNRDGHEQCGLHDGTWVVWMVA